MSITSIRIIMYIKYIYIYIYTIYSVLILVLLEIIVLFHCINAYCIKYTLLVHMSYYTKTLESYISEF